MYPYIYTPYGDISVFTCCVAAGVVALFVGVHVALRRDEYRDAETTYIFPRMVIAGFGGFFCSVLVDFALKYAKYRELRFYGMTFYGALIGASLIMFFLLKNSKGKTHYTVEEWFNILSCPFLLFHAFGRVGCFFGGCCYGRTSNSFLAVSFPDNEAVGIFHHGMKCLPTQLFEALALVAIFLIVMRVRRKYLVYLALYAPVRFALEFLRGDDRGEAFGWLSPSQWISLLIISGLLAYGICARHKTRNTT